MSPCPVSPQTIDPALVPGQVPALVPGQALALAHQAMALAMVPEAAPVPVALVVPHPLMQYPDTPESQATPALPSRSLIQGRSSWSRWKLEGTNRFGLMGTPDQSHCQSGQA